METTTDNSLDVGAAVCQKYTAVRFSVDTPEELVESMRGLGDAVAFQPQPANECYAVEVYLKGKRIFALRVGDA